MIQHFLNPPNWLTAASIACSLYAMILVHGTRDLTPKILASAAILIIIGGVLDTLDGRVARWLHRSSNFGSELDSFADLISFGVAPAFLVWGWKLHELGPFGTAIAIWWVLCAAFRLARFNVGSTGQAWPFPGHSQGLTTTMAGGSLATLVWVFNTYLLYWPVPAFVVATLSVVLSFLMISSIPFRNFRDMRKSRFTRCALAIYLVCCILGAIFLHPSMLFGVGAVLYLPYTVFDGSVILLLNRHTTFRNEAEHSRPSV